MTYLLKLVEIVGLMFAFLFISTLIIAICNTLLEMYRNNKIKKTIYKSVMKELKKGLHK